MMTVKEKLEELCVAEQFMVNFNNYWQVKDRDTIMEFIEENKDISCGFIWHDTPEGKEFWIKISDEIERLYHEYN